MRKNKVHQEVEQYTRRMLENKQLSHNGIDATEIAYRLNLDRSNVSRELNSLWRQGELIKLQGKPILFVDYKLVSIEYPNCYIPTTISKNASLTDYISKITLKEKNEFMHVVNSLDVIAGADGSLKEEVKKAIAAVRYPPYGIPMLILGDAGTGKRKFAEHIYYHMIEHGYRNKDSRFILINCADYADDDELFRKAVFGNGKTSSNKASKGLIESSNKGIVYFDDIQKLSSKSLSLLQNVVSNGYFTRFSENNERHLETSIIVSLTPDHSHEMPENLGEFFPTVIRLPNFNERNSFEKIEIILSLFAREAYNTRQTIFVSKSILYLFAAFQYRENETQLRNEIKSACSKAFMEKTSDSDSITIGFSHLSIEILSSKNQDISLSRTLAMYEKELIVLEADGKCEALDFFKNVQRYHSFSNLKQFIREFDIDAGNIMDFDYFINNTVDILMKLDDEHFYELQNSLDPMVYSAVYNVLEADSYYQKVLDNQRVLYGFCLMMENSARKQRNSSRQAASYSSIHQREYQNLQKINEELIQKGIGRLNRLEIEFYCEFLYLTGRILEHSAISILLICKGKHIAEEMVFNAAELAEKAHIRMEAINYTQTMQFNDLLELCYLAVNRLNNGSGVLVMVDSYPLNGIEEKLKKECNAKVKVVSSVSMNSLMDAIDFCGNYNDLDAYVSSSKSASAIKKNEYSDDQFINMLISDVLSKTILYVNPKRAADSLIFSLHLILDQLKMPYSQEIAVKYISHGMHMIERIVKNNALPYYQLKQFTDKNYQLMDIISQSLLRTENTFAIHVPDSEIAYLSEIFLELQQ